jgi:phosphate:Na+ symporter
LAAEKTIFRDLENKANQEHLARLRAGRTDTAEAMGMQLDVVRDLKRINAHLVSGTAYPVLERGGELLTTRVQSVD